MYRFPQDQEEEAATGSRSLRTIANGSNISKNALTLNTGVRGFLNDPMEVSDAGGEEEDPEPDEEDADAEELANARGDINTLHWQAHRVSLYTRVVVGMEKVEFVVSTKLLCHRSPFFNAACSEQWQSGPPGRAIRVELPEQMPLAFLIYVKWMYLNIIINVDNSSKTPRTKAMKWYVKASCWILGDYILDRDFCSVVTEYLMVDISKWYLKDGSICFMNRAVISYIYENTGDESSPIRRLMVDTWRAVVKPDVAKDFMIANTSSQCQEFYAEIMYQMTRFKREEPDLIIKPWDAAGCHYHSHEKGKCNVPSRHWHVNL
jgi:hypothetical protein